MKSKQVLYKDIPRDMYKRGWHFSFPFGVKDIYFKLDQDLADGELWQMIEKIKKYPKGIMDIHSLGQYNYFRVTYYPEEITEADIIEFCEEKFGE